MHPKQAGLIAAIWASMAVGPVSAQSGNLSSDTKIATVRFDSGNGTRGYLDAYMQMSYKLIVCDGDVHVAYSLIPDSAESDGRYYLNGKEWKTTAPLPTVSSISFDGSIGDGVRTIGSVGDKFAAKSLGMGCFSGQTKRVAPLRDLITLPASNENITYFLNSMALRSGNTEIRVYTGTTLTSARAEQEIANLAAARTAKSEVPIQTQTPAFTKPIKNPEQPNTGDIPDPRHASGTGNMRNQSVDLNNNIDGIFIVCVVQGKAYSPIYELNGSLEQVDAYAKANFTSQVSPLKFLSSMYKFRVSEDGMKGITFNTPSACVKRDSLELARIAFTQFIKTAGDSGVIHPWAMPKGAPEFPISMTVRD